MALPRRASDDARDSSEGPACSTNRASPTLSTCSSGVTRRCGMPASWSTWPVPAAGRHRLGGSARTPWARAHIRADRRRGHAPRSHPLQPGRHRPRIRRRLGTTPNIAGPVTLQLAPAVLAGASDAAFCLRSAGSPGFDVGRDSLVDVDLIDELFWFAADAGFPHSTWLRFGDHLTEGFGARDASSVEVLLSPRTAGILTSARSSRCGSIRLPSTGSSSSTWSQGSATRWGWPCAFDGGR